MGLIAFLISLIVLGFLYRRMIARDFPRPIGKAQATVPVLLGCFVSLPLSLVLTFACGGLLLDAGFTSENFSPITQSVIPAFFFAGLTEELAKGLMIILSFILFRRTVKNVYEYTLIGAAVGFGFTLPEEFLYGSDISGFLIRMDFIAGHMIFGIIMAYFLGMARYRKVTNQGSPTKDYILAAFLPVLTHTLYDACTVNNKLLTAADETAQAAGIIIGLGGALAAFVIQIILLLKYKKNANKLCSLRLLPEDSSQTL